MSAPKRINLALQGGGAHGAFTWGVLDRLLEEDDIEIVGAGPAGLACAIVLARAGRGVVVREDALERRRQGRLESTAEDIEAPVTAPAVDTALPGVGDGESLIYRREMYRTDI